MTALLNLHNMTVKDQITLGRLMSAVKSRQAEESFREYVYQAWPVILPGKDFIDNWHIDAMAEHLQWLSERQFLNLIINVPVRCSKSVTGMVLFPSWLWIHEPEAMFLTGSHKDELATRDAVATRSLIDSPWYQSAWGHRFKWKTDVNQKTRMLNTKGGGRTTFGMKSGVTGENSDFIGIDDPHSVKKAMWSRVERETVNNTYDQEVANRRNDPRRSCRYLIMQTLHRSDLTHHIMKNTEEEWVQLKLPMDFNPAKRCVTVNGFKDPRRKNKELLCPERFDRAFCKAELKRLTPVGYAAQMNQEPAPEGGGMVKLSWFRRYDDLPAEEDWLEIAEGWDTAQKANEMLNDPWVGARWIKTESGLYIVDMYREWHTYPTGKKAVIAFYERSKIKPHSILIEDKSTGSSLIQDLEDETTMNIFPFEPEGDKQTRFGVEVNAIYAGNVHLPKWAPWLEDFEDEITSFPNSEHKDQVDVTSMLLKHFREGGGNPLRIRSV